MLRLITISCFLMAAASLALSQNQNTNPIQQPPVTLSDPAIVVSKQKSDVEPVTIEKIYTTRQIGGSFWSPDGNPGAVFTKINGRADVLSVPPTRGWAKKISVRGEGQRGSLWGP